MRGMLSSTTIVSRDQYIERSADLQIQRIISEMARPGYVLVARQMGKTNLLLHTKEVMQSDKNIFVYADFSTMASYSEQECLNSLVDTAIESKFDLLSDAEEEIASLRKRESYNASKMFYRELRIILKYVDKLVFILDEIDALTRTEYSDRIFSLIRGHYYANTNYPELKRATYILSGVIEPKDIIKDPNISPFNIGEKIYMSDFTYDEFLHIIEHSEYLSGCSYDIIKRLYYWTKGQPRMSWDLCSAAEKQKVKTIEDVDAIVKSLYLISYDKAPIDAIREKVKIDSELREALIQLSIDKGDSLSDDVKSKLYLAGVIDYNQTSVGFKNPILSHSLTYDWLLAIHDHELNYLSVADKSIHLEKDYKKAISNLTKYLDSNPTDIEEVDKAHYLLGEAYYKSYRHEKSLHYINKIMQRGPETKLYYESVLLKGNALSGNEEYLAAEGCYREILNNADLAGAEIYFKALFGLVNVLISQDNKAQWDEAERLIKDSLSKWKQQLLELQCLSLAYYYLACIYIKKAHNDIAVMHIDSALKTAQPNERPYLLYIKHECVSEMAKIDTAKELYQSLDAIKTRPEVEDFDNALGFNLMFASRLLSMLMLTYQELDVTRYLRFFMYESKENAVIYIYEILLRDNNEMSQAFFEYIVTLLYKEDWMFDLAHRCNIALHQIREYNKSKVAETIISELDLSSSYYPDIIQELFSTIIFFYIKEAALKGAINALNVYHQIDSRIGKKREDKSLLLNYYECYLLYKENKLSLFSQKGAALLKRITEYWQRYESIVEDKLPVDDVKNITEQLKKWLSQTENNRQALGIKPKNYNHLERNARILVKYLSDGRILEGKYKHLEADLKLGVCILVDML